MPKYRSITLSVMSQWEMKQFPEFAHPDSLQHRYRGPALGADGSEPRRASPIPTTSGSTGKIDDAPVLAPSVSCYVPSIPGVRFFFKYTIEPPHPEGQLFYFKLFMNGRHICSWGVNPRTNPRGQVLRALFEADEKWNITENGGNVLKHGGIESRPFIFTPEGNAKSAADDGGLIEIRVFRAKGRKRRLPSLEHFKPQEQYGINLPSAGLVDKPQDTRFYDWILIDPKDRPYANFLFHYRSWEHLQSLQLIPPAHPRTLLKPSNSFAFLAGSARTADILSDEGANSVDGQYEEDSSSVLEDSNIWAPAVSNFRNSKMFLESNDLMDTNHQASISSSSPIEKEQSLTEMPLLAFSVPPAILDEWNYERPLPKLPKAKSSFDHSRKLSTSSTAPSITPSLIQWYERESENPSPEPLVEVAAAMPLLRSPPQARSSSLNARDRKQFPYLSSNSSVIDLVVKAVEEKALSPNVTLRKRNQSSSSITARPYTIPPRSDEEDEMCGDRTGRISYHPSEAEWLSRLPKPSPVKHDPGPKTRTPQICSKVEKLSNASEKDIPAKAKDSMGVKSWKTDLYIRKTQDNPTQHMVEQLVTEAKYSDAEWI